jgi:type VI protein secretion system component VasK
LIRPRRSLTFFGKDEKRKRSEEASAFLALTIVFFLACLALAIYVIVSEVERASAAGYGGGSTINARLVMSAAFFTLALTFGASFLWTAVSHLSDIKSSLAKLEKGLSPPSPTPTPDPESKEKA